jgi:hypothetical protein
MVIVTDAVLGDQSCTVLSAPVVVFRGRRVCVRVRRPDDTVETWTWGASEKLRVRRA